MEGSNLAVSCLHAGVVHETPGIHRTSDPVSTWTWKGPWDVFPTVIGRENNRLNVFSTGIPTLLEDRRLEVVSLEVVTTWVFKGIRSVLAMLEAGRRSVRRARLATVVIARIETIFFGMVMATEILGEMVRTVRTVRCQKCQNKIGVVVGAGVFEDCRIVRG